MDWIWIIIALLVGVAVGGITTYLTMRRRYGDREAVAELRAELDQYRARVTEHFVETADLVNTLTRTYKNVYDHLESGAYRLVGEETLRKQLDTVDEAPVMIEYMGQRRSGPPEDAVVTDRAGLATVRERRWTDAAGAREDAAKRAEREPAEPVAREPRAKPAAPEPDAATPPSEDEGAENKKTEL